MKFLTLDRKPTTPTETEAFLTMPGNSGGILATIERPWIEDPNGGKGGKPFESCVPAGTYQLIQHTRPDPDPTDDKPPQQVVALVNEELGVYYLEDDIPEGESGRFLILAHIANWPFNVVGCIGPGLYHSDSSRGRMVSSSAKAMRRLMRYIDGDDATLEIRWIQ